MFGFITSNNAKIKQQQEIIEANEKTITMLNERIKIFEEENSAKQQQIVTINEQHVKEMIDLQTALDTVKIQLTDALDQLQSKDNEIQQMMEIKRRRERKIMTDEPLQWFEPEKKVNGEQVFAMHEEINNLKSDLDMAYTKLEGNDDLNKKEIDLVSNSFELTEAQMTIRNLEERIKTLKRERDQLFVASSVRTTSSVRFISSSIYKK